MGARQYDPVTGRFLSIDPLFEKYPEQTPYQYAFNNPISFKDPTGFEPEGEEGKDEDELLGSLSALDDPNQAGMTIEDKIMKEMVSSSKPLVTRCTLDDVASVISLYYSHLSAMGAESSGPGVDPRSDEAKKKAEESGYGDPLSNSSNDNREGDKSGEQGENSDCAQDNNNNSTDIYAEQNQDFANNYNGDIADLENDNFFGQVGPGVREDSYNDAMSTADNEGVTGSGYTATSNGYSGWQAVVPQETRSNSTTDYAFSTNPDKKEFNKLNNAEWANFNDVTGSAWTNSGAGGWSVKMVYHSKVGTECPDFDDNRRNGAFPNVRYYATYTHTAVYLWDSYSSKGYTIGVDRWKR